MRPFLCLLATLLIFRLSTEAQSTLIEVSGPVSGSWTTDTVLVTGDIEVLSGEALIIDPGTLVLFTGHFTFMVKGSVEAAGSPSEPVRFSIADTSGFHDTLSDAGGWHGFVYEHLAASADSSLFDHCIFEYGKAFSADTFGQFGGAFRVFGFNRIAFRNCTSQTTWPSAGEGPFMQETQTSSSTAAPLPPTPADLPISRGDTAVVYVPFYPNPPSRIAILIPTVRPDSEVAPLSNIPTRWCDSIPFITTTAGLEGDLASSALLRLGWFPITLFTETRPISSEADSPASGPILYFTNLTVTGNQSAYGGGFYCNDSAVPVLYNTIIYGNEGFGHEVYIWDVRSAPSFLYSDIEGDTTDFEGSGAHGGYQGTYDHNINADPLFRNTGDFPYALLSGSPCIDAGTPDTAGLQLHGTDLEGLSRIYNGKIDIGAFEWNPGQSSSQWPSCIP